VDAAAKIIEEAANPEETIFGAVYDESIQDRIKITVIATGFDKNGQERVKSPADSVRSGNVVPMSAAADQGSRGPSDTSVAAEKPLDYRLASSRNDLDEPAFRRRRADL